MFYCPTINDTESDYQVKVVTTSLHVKCPFLLFPPEPCGYPVPSLLMVLV